ncbi:MAG: hypothetical protein NTY98_03705, partial [Verrucomicrobia bacterium]|nr:hypothetical protein [Verrucomicrobiota bacterium]
WGKTGVAHIHTVNFDFPYDDAALSWHLTDKQIRQITDIPLQLSELPPVRKAAGAAPRAQNPDPDSDTDPKKIIRQCDCLVEALALDMDSISHEALCSVSRNEAVVLQDCREKLMKRLTSIDEAAKRVQTFIEKGTVKEDTPEPSTTPKNNGSPANPATPNPATPNPASQPLR